MTLRPELNPGEARVLVAGSHAIVVGRRIMFARLVSCDCGWVDRFRYGHRRQLRVGRAHLDRNA